MFVGDLFGELVLLYDIIRVVIVICKGMVEFLMIDKLDFDMVYICFYNFYIFLLIIIEFYYVYVKIFFCGL